MAPSGANVVTTPPPYPRNEFLKWKIGVQIGVTMPTSLLTRVRFGRSHAILQSMRRPPWMFPTCEKDVPCDLERGAFQTVLLAHHGLDL